jgi:Tol biopolymer transport system component
VDPDGAATLVYQFHLRDVNVWQYDIGDGLSNAKPLTDSTSLDYNPQYSPDGRQLAFVSKRSGVMEIWVCGSDASNARQLTSRRQGFTDSPRWSPDGEWIAFTSNEGSNRDIYVVPRSGGSERRVTDNPSEEGRPSWSVDGKWIYFRSSRSGEPQIWKVRWEGGNPIQVTKGGGYEGFESPDGKTLYYVRRRQWTGLWEVPVAGGPERLVLDDVYQTGWAVTRDAIYYRAHPSKELRRWDLGSGKISVIGQLGGGLGLHGSALTVRLDGSAVAFSQKDSDRLDLFTLTVPDWRRSWR